MRYRILVHCIGFFLIVFSKAHVHAQTGADSLLQVLNKEELPDSTRIDVTHEIISMLHFSDPQKCLELLQEIESLMQVASKGRKLDQLHHYGNTFHSLGNMDTMEYFNRKILSLVTREEDDLRYARALRSLGLVYGDRNQLQEAERLYHEVIEIFEARQDSFSIGAIRNSLGLIYDAEGDYRSSMREYLKAYDIFRAVKHEGAQGIILNNLGRVYQTQRNFDKAIDYYKRYMAICTKLGRQSGVATALNNIGAAYSDMLQLDSAEHYLLASVRMKEEIDYKNDLAASLSNLAKVANLEGNHQAAIQYAEQGLKYAREYKNIKDQSFCLLELARAYAGMEAASKAKTAYLKALELAEEMKNIKLRFDINEGLYLLHRAGNPITAIGYLEQAYVLKDSILNEENVEALTTLRLEHEFNEKQLIDKQRINTLELQEKLQSARLGNQKAAIITLASLLTVLGALLFILFKQKNRISQQNEVINQALKEKDMLLKEIHHRVKNNLQVISSLLGIQTRNVQDQAARDALNEGRNRVLTMSLIHQNLYQLGNFTGIEVASYFQKLVENLFATYNISEEKITLKSQIDQLILDVDTVIPLGLVLNELISNSLKHAFPNGRGSIKVELQEKDQRLHLLVADNGVGVEQSQIIAGSTYGYELIQALVDKLDGQLTIDNQQGTDVRVIFRHYHKAA